MERFEKIDEEVVAEYNFIDNLILYLEKSCFSFTFLVSKTLMPYLCNGSLH